MQTVPEKHEQLREEIRERYARTARPLLEGSACCTPPAETTITCCGATSANGSCCDTGCCSSASDQAITSDLYSEAETLGLPVAAVLASRGCGNPTALAQLREGERVLDLGSGGGIDVLLSARRVGPTGFVYGLDMTDAMLELAERNRQEAGIENVRFLMGEIEQIPLPDTSVDVVISNCVINLSADKGQVLREAQRVLAPGGRFAVSDIVFQGQFPAALRADLESWAGCIAGALEEVTYRRLLAEAGFSDIEIEVFRSYSLQDLAESGTENSLAALSEAERADLDGKFVSAFIRARKPPVE